MKNERRSAKVGFILFCLVSALLPFNLAASGDQDGSGSKRLTIYCALPETEIPSYVEAFKEDTGITVDFVRLSAGEILSKVQVEKNNPQASVWYGGNCDTFIAAAGNDLLEPYTSPELKNIPESYRDPKGFWSPVYVGALAFAVDKGWFADRGMAYPLPGVTFSIPYIRIRSPWPIPDPRVRPILFWPLWYRCWARMRP